MFLEELTELPFFVKALFSSLSVFLVTLLINRKQKVEAQVPHNPDFQRCFSNKVTSMKQLREVIPAGLSGSGLADAKKVKKSLDKMMIGFIEKSPFLHLATSSKEGLPFIAPKGDEAGFVKIASPTRLLFPERPGNKLIFGMQNIIENPRVGLCFQIPGTCTTLRVGGKATLTTDPKLLQDLAARGRAAVIAICIDIEYAFFHCAKAYLRSRLWKPDSWPKEAYNVTFGQYFSDNPAIKYVIDKKINSHYEDVQRSVDGKGKEPAI